MLPPHSVSHSPDHVGVFFWCLASEVASADKGTEVVVASVADVASPFVAKHFAGAFACVAFVELLD